MEILADRMGRRLGEAVFCGDAAQSAGALMAQWRTTGARAQLALQAIDTSWARLPLETMMAPRADRPLALTPHLDLFRMGNDRAEMICPDIPGPLKILMALAFEVQDGAVARFLADLIYAGKTHILITCRYPFELPDGQHRRLQLIELGSLSPAATRKLMMRLAGFDTLKPDERHQVAQTVGGHPRTLELADAILRDGRFTYPDVESRLLKKLPPDVFDRIKRHADLSASLREAVAGAARDCLVDQLLELLLAPEKELLFLLSVFLVPRPADTIQWLIEKQDLKMNAAAAVAKLVRLSLVTAYAGKWALHRWTAEYLKQIMGNAYWKQANHLAGDHYYTPENISLDDAFSAWRHYLKSEDLEKAHQVAGALEDKLDIWGHWDLRRIVCEIMLEHSSDHPAIHAVWLHNTGVLQQAQGDYDGARAHYQKSLEIKEKLGDLHVVASHYHQLGMIQHDQGDYEGARAQYQKSLEIKEKLGDLSGMANTYGQLGIFMRQHKRHSEAFRFFFQAL